jgi:hypothetical protein
MLWSDQPKHAQKREGERIGALRLRFLRQQVRDFGRGGFLLTSEALLSSVNSSSAADLYFYKAVCWQHITQFSCHAYAGEKHYIAGVLSATCSQQVARLLNCTISLRAYQTYTNAETKSRTDAAVALLRHAAASLSTENVIAAVTNNLSTGYVRRRMAVECQPACSDSINGTSINGVRCKTREKVRGKRRLCGCQVLTGARLLESPRGSDCTHRSSTPTDASPSLAVRVSTFVRSLARSLAPITCERVAGADDQTARRQVHPGNA